MTDAAYGMWERLDLDLAAHDALLAILGKFYGDIYLSQQGRLKERNTWTSCCPKSMGCASGDPGGQGGRAKVVGTFCVFVPES